jgi:ribosomal protein S12 methylthiotransferase accessory factor
MDQAGLAKIFDHLESLNLYDHQLIAAVIGIVFDIDSPWASLSIGELKSLLLLAMGNHQEAIHWCSWTLDHGDLPPSRKRLFRLLQDLLGLSLAGQEAGNYSNILNLLYSEEELRHGQAIVDGQRTFPGLVFGGSWPEISQEHARLLRLHEKINVLKTSGSAR